MHHFVVKFSKFSSHQAARGTDPLTKILQRRAGVAAERPVGRRYRSTAVGAQQQRRRRTTAVSSKCEQCHVYSRRRRLNTDLLPTRRYARAVQAIALCLSVSCLSQSKGMYGTSWFVALRLPSTYPGCISTVSLCYKGIQVSTKAWVFPCELELE